MFISRLHKKKGAEILIHALEKLKDQGVLFQFILAGAGEEIYVERLKEYIILAGLAERTTFVGNVTGELKLSLLQAADIMVLPTHQENFGYVFPEALACGTPVITTSGVGICTELMSSGGAIIVDRIQHAFASAIKLLLQNSNKRRKMGIAGRRWVFEAFSYEKTLSEYVKLYNSLI